MRLENADVEEILGIYADGAARHRAATDAGNPRRANRAHDRLAAAYRELRRRGPEAQRSLLPFLEHHDIGVRGWAAAHALEFAPEDGERTLLELERRPGLEGFSASRRRSRCGARANSGSPDDT